MSPAGSGPQRVRAGHVAWVAERMSARDWAIVQTVNRLRLVTGWQLERLHFAELVGRSRAVSRWRVLKRLCDWRVLMAMSRRVGGSLRGSTKLAFALDSAGQRLLQLPRHGGTSGVVVRRPGVPSERFKEHSLAVSELYVCLVELACSQAFTLGTFLAEPACWWPDGRGGRLEPDAYVSVSTAKVTDHWWVEVDRDQESLPTMRRKLMVYLEFLHSGQVGPGGVMPRVVVMVPNERRREAVRGVVALLPGVAGELFVVARQEGAAGVVVDVLEKTL